MKKQLTIQQQIAKLERSIRKFGDQHGDKIPALEELKKQEAKDDKRDSTN